jgi:hypothetical protein
MLIYAEIEGETIMSQQRMDFDETNRQQQQPPFDNYGTGYRDPFMSSYAGQKLSSQGTSGSSGASAGMRLALAIVSLCLLVPISAIVLGISNSAGAFGLLGGLIVLGVICLTIIVVNVAFNYRR